ncbi:helix-turn-helix domain-containing protein [Fulvivirga sp. M361]|uniref:helix-turn-helix domain-containing protein n=1 Tax=Fulvivirga sp. M361 TaxID=2594266 RepID=UPI00117A41F2|nr:helix-turn-helix domain-containing protein [Fulvivirga sp. M361]TRX48608.1 helix-turn-helix domain-containing protein [Fulvivirga sp. M361]
MDQKKENHLPVYCIATFQDANTHELDFDIKILEELVDEFEFVNQPHRHDFYDILFITEGTGTHTIDFITYEVKPCSIFFLTPGQVHSWDLSHDVKGFSIFFKPDFYLMDHKLKKLLDFPFFHTMNTSPALYFDCRIDPIVKQVIHEIYRENQTAKLGREKVVRAYLDILLIKLSRHYHRLIGDEHPRPLTYRIRELESLIDTNFRTYKQPSEYADMMSLSLKHLNSLCKKGLNKTVGQLIQERIVLESKRLLLHSDQSISEISYNLGYNDNSYFARFFRNKMNLSPDEYRKTFPNVPKDQ